MLKNHGGSSSIPRSSRMEPDIGIRASTMYQSFPKDLKNHPRQSLLWPVRWTLFSDGSPSCRQLSKIIGQFRSMDDELKKIKANRYNDWIERISDNKELKSFILNLSNRTGASPESIQRPSSVTSFSPRSNPNQGIEIGRSSTREGPILHTPSITT